MGSLKQILLFIMKKLTTRIILTLASIALAACSTIVSFGQSQHLGVTLVSPDYPQLPNDSAFEGPPGYDSVTITIHNADLNNVFTGTIAVVCYTDSGAGVFLPVDTLIHFAGTTYTIAPNSTVTITRPTDYFFDPGHYKVGSNIVVVWPVANGVTTIDSFYTDVFFVAITAIRHPLRENIFMDIFPNPCISYIQLSHEINVEAVRIYNANGQLVFEKTVPLPLRFEMRKLEKGIYIVETVFKNNSRQFKRFMKM